MIGAQAIVKCLEKENTEVIFGYSGVAIDPFWNSIEKQEKEDKTKSLSSAMVLLGERNQKKGALFLNIDQFKSVFRFLNRVVTNYKNTIYILLYSINSDQDVDIEKATDCFAELASGQLRVSDCVTKYSRNQVMVVLLNLEACDIKIVTDRIEKKWEETEYYDQCELLYEMDRLQKDI